VGLLRMARLHANRIPYLGCSRHPALCCRCMECLAGSHGDLGGLKVQLLGSERAHLSVLPLAVFIAG